MAMGCDFGQGPVLLPPLPQERFLKLLLQRISRPEDTVQGEHQGEQQSAATQPAQAMDG
jgi:hypothetical protein